MWRRASPPAVEPGVPPGGKEPLMGERLRVGRAGGIWRVYPTAEDAPGEEGLSEFGTHLQSCGIDPGGPSSVAEPLRRVDATPALYGRRDARRHVGVPALRVPPGERTTHCSRTKEEGR